MCRIHMVNLAVEAKGQHRIGYAYLPLFHGLPCVAFRGNGCGKFHLDIALNITKANKQYLCARISLTNMPVF